MTPANHIPQDDLALFALALMPPEEAAQARAHLDQCEICRAEVARLQGDLVAYAMTAERHDPPPASRTRFVEAIAREQRPVLVQPAAEEPTFTPRSRDVFDRRHGGEEPARRGFGFFGWLGWALAAGLAAGAFLQFRQAQDLRSQLQSQAAPLRQGQPPAEQSADIARAEQVLRTLTDPTAMQVALHLPQTPGTTPKPEGHASYVPDQGDLVFVASHLKPISPGKTYELWLLPATGQNPIPAGVFRPDQNGNASVVLPSLPRNIAAKGFGVTIENAGGSDVPTPPIVLAGTQS